MVNSAVTVEVSATDGNSRYEKTMKIKELTGLLTFAMFISKKFHLNKFSFVTNEF